MRQAAVIFWIAYSLQGQTAAPAPAGQAKPTAAPAKPAAVAPKPAAVAPKPAATAPKPTATAKPAAAKPAAKTDPFLDSLVEMKTAGLSDELILRAVAKQNKAYELTPTEMVRLKKGGLNETVLNALMDPKSIGSAPAVAPAAAAAAVPSAAVVEPTPVAAAPAAAPTPVAVPASNTATRRKLAVDEFEYSTVKTQVQAIFQTQVDIGKGIRALMVTRLQQGGKVTVLERAQIKKVMGEQDFGASNRVQKGTNARIGRIIGADAMLMGDIVTFGYDDKNQRVNVGAVIGRRVPGLGGLSVGKKEDKAVVVIAYRLVDAETGEIIDTGEARGESSRKGKLIGGMVGVPKVAAGGGYDMSSSNFRETIIGEAVTAACDKLGEIMNGKIPTLPQRSLDVEGRVADVAGGSITINVGSGDGVAIGDTFEIHKIVKELKDPVTKEVLDLQTDKVGEMIVANVRERIATGSYGGTAAAANGYVARKKLPKQ